MLLVDLASRSIVFANTVAQQLAPGVGLPAGLDQWSDAAALRDVDGSALSSSVHPLSAVAESRPVLGQAVSAARSSELGERRDPLWVVALPLSGAPQLEGHALVVFLPLAGRQGAQDAIVAQGHADLRERAILATGMSFTMSDAQADDMPLIWVNPAFTTTTGYEFDEAVGRNCRFLQGEDSDPAARALLHDAVREGRPANVTLLNYRKDGSSFWNQVSLSPIYDAQNVLTHYVGIQTDVTHRVMGDNERDRALEAEKQARQCAETAQRNAERSQRHLSMLAEATSQLAATLDVSESLQRLSSLVVPLLADWVIIATIVNDGSVRELVTRHKDGREEAMAEYEQNLRAGFSTGSIVQEIINGAPARLINDYGSAERRAQRASWVANEHAIDVSDSLGINSAMFIPLPGRDHIDGIMFLLRSVDSPSYNEQDLAVADDLGRRAGLILDNARLYQSEHRIAETLQRSLLPDIPVIPQVRSAARYRASETGAAVGGDFYELIPLRNKALGVVIGDVVGHDVYAAAAMGHLRGLLRACAWDEPSGGSQHNCEDPAKVLDRVDELIRGLSISTMASVAYASLEPQDDSTWLMRYSNAGHPPMLVRTPDGAVESLDDAGGLMLGIQSEPHVSAERTLRAGTTIVAYTDGLIERRTESLADGLAKLEAALTAGPDDPEELCNHLLDSFDDSDNDDVAILVLTI